MKRAIYIIVLLAVSSVLVCGEDEQPSPCPNLLARLYECVDHVAYYQANDAKGEMDTIMGCCKQYDVYTEAKCFWYRAGDTWWHLHLDTTPHPGMDHGPTLIPVSSTLPQAGYEAAQQAAEKAARQAAKLPTPSVVKRGPAKDLATTTLTEQRDIDLTMEFSGVSGIDTDELSAALDRSLAMLGSTSGPGPHAVAHAKENGDVTVDVEYAVTGQDMGAVVDNIHMVMDTIKRTVSTNPAALAAQQTGRPLSVDVSVELRDGNTGMTARSARSMAGDDDWTRVLADSLQGGIPEEDQSLMGGPQPIPLRTVQTLRVKDAVEALQRMAAGAAAQGHAVSKVGFEAAEHDVDALKSRVDDQTPVSTADANDGKLPVPQLAAILHTAVANAMDVANPLMQQRQFVALPALVKDNTAEPLEASLLADNGEAGATVQLDVEHEVELTITAVEESVVRFEVTTKSPPASQLPVQVDGGMEQPPSLLHGWGAPLALEWLTMQGSWLVVHYWDVLMVLSLVNLAGVLCMALRLYQLERARDMQVVQEVEQFLVDARDVYQDKDLEAPLLASEHRLG